MATAAAPAAAAVAGAAPHAAPSADCRRHDRDGGGRSGEYRLASDRRVLAVVCVGRNARCSITPRRPIGRPLVRADTDSDGSVLRITRIVDDAANNFHVRPSPDGSRIAFDSDRDGVRGVYVADADGKHVRRVSGEGFARGAELVARRPDARVRARRGGPSEGVEPLDAGPRDAASMRQITSYRYGQPWGGSWFPDGRRIAYSHETRLIIRDLETGRGARVSTRPRKGRLVRTPAVSPDGRRIVFQVHRDGTWLLELRDGSMRQVLEDPTAEEYTWAPDGRRLAYHSRRSGGWGVWVMAPR